MKLRHAAALAFRWFAFFMTVGLLAVASIGLAVLVVIEYLQGEKMTDTVVLLLMALIPLAFYVGVYSVLHSRKQTGQTRQH